ncbi:hypothetical protein QTP88_029458 [Uroleucon formosanum]
MGKPTTPNNTTTTSKKVTTRSTSSIPPSNSDIMVALDKLRGEVLSSNKIISSTQTLQFEELKKDLKQLSLQIIELKAENTTLRSELNILKGKITSLEDAGSPSQSSHVISQILQESFERQRCSLNTIIYGVPESSSASAAQRISDDCSSIRSLLEPHSLVIPDNSKVIRLGKVVAGKSRPIKLLCGSSESSSKLVSDFRDLVKNGIQFPTGFRIVSDKTLMQRTLLRSCYAELENCKLNGETNLEISYVNGAPQVRIAKSKNTGFLHHAITESLDSLVPPDPYHPPLTINFYNNIHVPGLNSTHSFFDFDNADYINIHNFISNFDWPSTLSALSVDSAFNTFYDAFHQSVLRFVPKRHFKHFSLLRAHYKYLSKKLYREFVDRTELSINANPSNFWKFIKKQRFNSDIPKTLTLNGASSSNEQDAADMFAIYFKSVYSCEVVNDDVSDLKILSFDLPNNAYFTVDDVFHSLSTLSGAKNVGPDGLPGVFLLQLRSIIAYPYANLTPVHKSGVKSDISNYRPISIQSHLSKLFESLVLNSIKPSVNNILIEEQHGFRPGRSTTTCNLVFSNFVFDSFKKRSQVDVVYTDLAKAFDTVNHSVLLRVLETSGFGEPVLSWFGSFLVNRLQWVKLFGIKSNIFSSTSGVPQDDMKLFMEINSAADCENLQSSLDCFVSWCLKIGLKVNASKCRVMTFTRSRSTILFDYNISGLTIERVDNLIDLGFKLSSTLSPSPHFAMITSRAFKVLGFIMRLSKDFKLSKSLKSLYCALVRPILEYGSVVWDPYTVSDINQLERVQLRFLRFCCFVLVYKAIIRSKLDYGCFLFGSASFSNWNRLNKVQSSCLRSIMGYVRSSPLPAIEVESSCPPSNIRCRWLAGKFLLKSLSYSSSPIFDLFYSLFLTWRYVPKNLPVISLVANSVSPFHEYILTNIKLPIYEIEYQALLLPAQVLLFLIASVSMSCLQPLNSFSLNYHPSPLIIRIKSILFSLGQLDFNMQFLWVPSHVGFRGNEYANSLAKSSSNFISPSFSPIPWSDFTPLLRHHIFNLWSAYWLYKAIIRSKLDYGCFLFGSASFSNWNRLNKVQSSCLRSIMGYVRSSPLPAIEVESSCPPSNIRCRWLAGKFLLKSLSYSSSPIFDLFYSLFLTWRYVPKNLPVISLVANSVSPFHEYILTNIKLPIYEIEYQALLLPAQVLLFLIASVSMSCLQPLNSFSLNYHPSPLIIRIKSILFSLGQLDFNMQFLWVPSHVGFRGNEYANSLAKSSSNFISPSFSPIPWSDFTPLLRHHIFNLWSAYWLYKAIIRSKLDYGCFLFGSASFSNWNRLNKVQSSCLRSIMGYVRSSPLPAIEVESSCPPSNIRCRWLAGKFLLKSLSYSSSPIFDLFYSLFLTWRYVPKNLPVISLVANSVSPFHEYILTNIKLPIYEIEYQALLLPAQVLLFLIASVSMSCLQPLNSFSLNYHPSPLIIRIKSILFSLGQLDFNMQFLWVPSHVGFRGNEYANSLAKSSSNFISPSFSPIPWSDFTPLLRHHIFNLWSAYWLYKAIIRSKLDYGCFLFGSASFSNWNRLNKVQSSCLRSIMGYVRSSPLPAIEVESSCPPSNIRCRWLAGKFLLKSLSYSSSPIFDLFYSLFLTWRYVPKNLPVISLVANSVSPFHEYILTNIKLPIYEIEYQALLLPAQVLLFLIASVSMSCLQPLNSFSLNYHPSPLIIRIKSILFSLGQLDFNMQFLWVPSHVGFRGNEYANSLAKSSSNFISPSFSPIPWSDFTPLLRHHIFNLWSAYWLYKAIIRSKLDYGCFLFGSASFSNWNRLNKVQSSCLRSIMGYVRSSPLPAIEVESSCPPSNIRCRWLAGKFLLKSLSYSSSPIFDLFYSLFLTWRYVPKNLPVISLVANSVSPFHEYILTNIKLPIYEIEYQALLLPAQVLLFLIASVSMSCLQPLNSFSLNYHPSPLIIRIKSILFSLGQLDFNMQFLWVPSHVGFRGNEYANSLAKSSSNFISPSFSPIPWSDFTPLLRHHIFNLWSAYWLYKAIIRSKLDYGCFLFGSASFSNWNRLNKVQSSCLRSIMGYVRSSPLPAIEVESSCPPSNIRCRWLAGKFLLKSLSYSSSPIFDLFYSLFLTWRYVPKNLPVISLVANSVSPFHEYILTNIKLPIYEIEYQALLLPAQVLLFLIASVSMSCLQPLNSFSLNYHPSPLIIRIKSILFSLGQLDFNMQFLWVPSHVGFRGNEYANSLAKSSSNFISPSFSPIPWSDFTPLLRHHIFNLWSAYWLYKAIIRSKLDYGCFLFGSASFSNWNRLNKVQSSCLRSIMGYVRSSPLPAIEVESSCPPSNIRCRWLAGKFLLKSLSYSSSPIFDLFYSLFLTWRYVPKNLPVISLVANSVSPFHEYILTNIKLPIYEIEYQALLLPAQVLLFLIASVSMSCLQPLNSFSLNYHPSPLIIRIKSILFSLGQLDFNMQFLWVPSHVGFRGNEYANSLAKSSSNFISPSFSPIPWSDFTPLLRHHIFNLWSAYWLYKAIIRSKLDYGCFLFGSASFSNWNRLNKVQSSCLRSIMGYVRSSPLPAIEVESSCPPSNIRCRWLAGKFLLKSLSYSSSPIFDLFYSLFLTWRYVPKNLPVISLVANSVSPFHEYILTNIKLPIYEIEYQALLLPAQVLLFLIASVSMSCLQPLNSFSLNYHPSPLIIRIKSILFSLGQLDFNMQFLWVPSHVGFRGNEYANSLAKSSSNFISPSFSPIPWSDFTPLLRHHIFNLWSAYWLYKAIIRSKLDYGCFLFGSASFSNWNRLNKVQSSCLRSIMGYVRSSPLPAIEVESSCPPSNIRCRWLAGKFLLKSLSYSSSPIFDLFYSLFLTWRYVPKNLPVISLVANSVSPFHEYILTNIKLPIYEIEYQALLLPAQVLLFLIASVSMSCLQPLNSFSLNYHPSPLIIRIKSILFSLGQLDFNMQFLWVPSHVGFRGNEYANSLAKSSSNFISPSFSPIPWSDFTPLLRHHIFNLWSAYWQLVFLTNSLFVLPPTVSALMLSE